MPQRWPSASHSTSPSDNVCVAVIPLEAGSDIESADAIRRLRQCPWDKIGATRSIEQGEPVAEDGQDHRSTRPGRRPGDWGVHMQIGDAGGLPPRSCQRHVYPSGIPNRYGLHPSWISPSGRARTRNYIAVHFLGELLGVGRQVHRGRFGPTELAAYPHVDGVLAFTHFSGCGVQFGGTAHAMLNRVLAGIGDIRNCAYRWSAWGANRLSWITCCVTSNWYRSPEQRFERPDNATVLTMQDQGGTAARWKRAS